MRALRTDTPELASDSQTEQTSLSSVSSRTILYGKTGERGIEHLEENQYLFLGVIRKRRHPAIAWSLQAVKECLRQRLGADASGEKEINRVLNSLEERGFVDGFNITETGEQVFQQFSDVNDLMYNPELT